MICGDGHFSVQYTTDPAAPDCGFLPKPADCCPRSKRPPHLDGGWWLYRNDDYQGTPAALVTASTIDEAATEPAGR